ncbi:hypothetical protein [Streptomyces morookaense]|uniref:Uncharacterized protein n=1 Tax=Streptomyces morookaense TaxID=1970 RepID=A0A7Y7B9L7_STRMO|nr:hypothetical protein [Streptomyces morookaense]NVK81577.1 hypothetical protein [Streptomyces morookaense]
MDTLTFVAAPLFAGTAIATIGVLGADSDKFRWPALSMLMLTLAALALATSIQVALHGRRFLYTVDEARSWGASPDGNAPGAASAGLTVEAQAADFELWVKLSGRATWAYQIGLALLKLGLACILAPPANATPSDSVIRWIASGAVVCALCVHIILISKRVRERARRLSSDLRLIMAHVRTP